MTWWMWAIVILIIAGMFGNSKEQAVKDDAKEATAKRRKEAEDYIMNSGDLEAIKTLKLAQANPANYTQSLSKGMNSGNDTLKTALGVMTGVVAGNMISQAINSSAISYALEEMKTNLDSTFDSLTDSDTATHIDSDTSDYDV